MHDRLQNKFCDKENVNNVLCGTVLYDLLQNGRMRNTCELQQVIGRGGFGAVFHVIDKETRMPSAIKVVPLSLRYSELDTVANNSAFREVVSTLRDLNPMHVVQLHGHWLEEPDSLPPSMEAACEYFWDPEADSSPDLGRAPKDTAVGQKKVSMTLGYHLSQLSAMDVIRGANSELREGIQHHHSISRHQFSSIGISARFDKYSEKSDSGNDASDSVLSNEYQFSHENSSWGSLGFDKGVLSSTTGIQGNKGKAHSDSLVTATKDKLPSKRQRPHETDERQHKFIKVVLIIQMELCSKADNIEGHMTLRDWLHRPQKKEADERREMVDVLSHFLLSVRHIHRKRLLHSDIKPENIFVSSAKGQPIRVRLADFGMSSSLKDKQNSIGGTPLYTPPDETRTEKSDMFSCGVVILECLYYRFVNQGPSRMERAKILEEFVKNGTVPVTLQRLPKVAHLVQGMCNAKQHLRLSAEDVCKQLKELKVEIMRANLSISEQNRHTTSSGDSNKSSSNSSSAHRSHRNMKARKKSRLQRK